jgi:hypothetical protein
MEKWGVRPDQMGYLIALSAGLNIRRTLFYSVDSYAPSVESSVSPERSESCEMKHMDGCGRAKWEILQTSFLAQGA